MLIILLLWSVVGPWASYFLQTVLAAFGGWEGWEEEDFWHMFIEFNCGIQKCIVAQNKPIRGSRHWKNAFQTHYGLHRSKGSSC